MEIRGRGSHPALVDFHRTSYGLDLGGAQARAETGVRSAHVDTPREAPPPLWASRRTADDVAPARGRCGAPRTGT